MQLLKSKLPISVRLHILICLSHFNAPRFSTEIEQCQFIAKIKELEEHIIQNDNIEIDEGDKSIMLDLCKKILNPKVVDSQKLDEDKQLTLEEKINGSENDNNEIIFERFTDELN